MNPFYFGSGQRRLFGVYTPGRGGGRPRAIVLCHPWGPEYLRAHRSMRMLGAMLTTAGFHVLRFDYFGSGDSGGNDTDVDLAGWRADIEMAMEELQETTGASKVSLVGLRLGATLAASVAAKRAPAVDAVVLWDPVVSGAEYLRELWQTARGLALVPGTEPVGRGTLAGGGHEILGFALTSLLHEELQGLDLLRQVPGLPARTLAVVSGPRPSYDSLRQTLAGHALGPLPLDVIESRPAWLEDEDSGAGAVPVKVLQRVVQWLG